MALLRVNLPPRNLVGIYSRIVRRELGLPGFFPPFPDDLGRIAGFFARSLAVAVGQAFAAGKPVRAEFAVALRDRLRQYKKSLRSGFSFRWQRRSITRPPFPRLSLTDCRKDGTGPSRSPMTTSPTQPEPMSFACPSRERL